MMASQLYLLDMRLGLILTGILLASTLTLTEQLSQHKIHHNHLSARTLKGDREPNLHNTGKESTTAKQYDSNQKRSTFITTLLHDYAEDVPPNFDQGEAIEVRCAMHINTFDSINESSMDYELNIFMREYWTDHRLAYNTSIPDESITLDPRMIDRIWVPDTFFHNEKKGSFHDITVPNRLLRIRQDGSIEYSIRLSLTLSCPMVLNKFPMDSQICYAQIESYAYTTDKILLRWAERDAVEIVPNLELPQFQLTRLSYGECYRNYSTGSFPCLQIKLLPG
ncbi:unnamed protein product [Owenia fusiformis]|uniref:Uncharacterized protein n=1 Tax=Owenia fusiformis TaxID=6347 RepID=A0A8J1XKV6_OWEFU|nr:unnamed protein product [Owenia fusiformis]